MRSSFIADLSFEDLKVLRSVVRRVYLQRVGSQHSLTDYEADKYIESLGPQTREAMVRVAVDRHRAG